MGETTEGPIFDSLTHLVQAGRPGDRFSKDAATGKRNITTYVFLERLGPDAAVIEHVHTSHRGPAEIAGYLERCYISTAKPISMEARGGIIRSHYELYDGTTRRLRLEEGVARYSAKNLRGAHAAAVKVYDAATADDRVA